MRYHHRLFAWLLGYSLLMVAGFVAFQYFREREFKREAVDARLQGVNDEVLSALGRGMGMAAIDSLIGPELRVTLIDMHGRVLYDSALDSLPSASHMHRPEIVSALARGSGHDVRRHSQTTGQTYFYSAKTDGQTIVRTAMPYTQSAAGLLGPDYGFLWYIGILAAVMCTLGYLATRRMGRHVEGLRRFARRAESGEKIEVPDSSPRDELGEISSHIVSLYSSLQSSRLKEAAEREKAAEQVLDKERLKKQLTQNINHELKTPVATMRLCLETLISHPDMPAPRKEEFLARCMAGAERLAALLEDVSLLTRMDEGSRMIEKRSTDITRIIADVCSDYALRAADKGITVADTIRGSYFIEGNDSLLASVFHNLMANAIAYSGATRIEISVVSADERGLMLRFADNGCGVPAEHLPRLFERFYRVDKGRSRRNGGTGLGLSIVRNAVAIHGGSIMAENAEGGGLVFTIFFPKDNK